MIPIKGIIIWYIRCTLIKLHPLTGLLKPYEQRIRNMKKEDTLGIWLRKAVEQLNFCVFLMSSLGCQGLIYQLRLYQLQMTKTKTKQKTLIPTGLRKIKKRDLLVLIIEKSRARPWLQEWLDPEFSWCHQDVISLLSPGFISGPCGIPWQLQSLPHGAKMTAIAPASTSSWHQAQWEGGRTSSKSFKQSAQYCLWLVWLAEVSQSLSPGGWLGLGWMIWNWEWPWNTRVKSVKRPNPSHAEAR